MASAPPPATANLGDRAPPVPAPGIAVVPWVKVGSFSASEKARALSNRSAGNFSSAFAIAAATFGGTDLRNAVTGCTGSAMIFMMICCAELPVCGGSPASVS